MQNNDRQVSNMQQGMKQRVASPSLCEYMCVVSRGCKYGRVRGGGMTRKDRNSISATLLRFMCATAFLFPMTGCNMTDPMIQEMETAYATALQSSDSRALEERVVAIKQERAASGAPLVSGIDYAAIARTEAEKEERKEAVSRAVQKYFPPGMRAEEAFKRLRQLKGQGFEISEARNDGTRAWPGGEFRPYRDEATRRNLQQRYPKGISKFLAEKKYDTTFSTQMWFVTKHVVLSFSVVDGSGVISEVKGDIWASGI